MKKENSRVAVLLAAYNGCKWIEMQLETISTQKHIDSYIFISIDPSTDNTEKICHHFTRKNPKTTILPNTGKFGGAAANFFHLLSDVNFYGFEYIALSDQDDIWYQDKLSVSVEMLKQHQCVVYSSNVTAFWPNGKQKLVDKSHSQVKWDYLFESAGPGCTFVMTQNLALELQAFVRTNKEIMSSVWLHDWFIYAFARSHGYKWHIDKRPSMLYRQHESNQIGVNSGYKAFLHRAVFVLSGKALEQSVIIARLCGLESHPFVKRWSNLSRWGMLYLAFNANKCRRKLSEKIVFMFSCLLLAIIGHKKL